MITHLWDRISSFYIKACNLASVVGKYEVVHSEVKSVSDEGKSQCEISGFREYMVVPFRK